jgi:hypothetical protein
MSFLVMLAFSDVSAAATNVVITSPAANRTTPNEVGVVAYSYGPETVRVLQVYLDGVKKYESVWPARERINALISTTSGSHQLTVQALDPNSAVVGKTTITFSTTSSPTVLSDLDERNWNECDPAHDCDSGGNQEPTPPEVSWFQSPNRDGQSVKFPTQNPADPYNTAYWWVTHTAPQGSVAHYFKYEFDLWIPIGFGDTPQALEWECQQTVNGYVYNFAWQAQYVRSSSGGQDNLYKVYRYPSPTSSGAWEEVNLPLTRYPEGEWSHIVAEYHVDQYGTVWHDALTVSSSLGTTRLDPYWYDAGTGAYKSISHVPPYWAGRNNQFSNAFQLDVNGSGTEYHVFVENMKLTYVP